MCTVDPKSTFLSAGLFSDSSRALAVPITTQLTNRER